MNDIRIGDIANTVFKPGQRRGPAHAQHRLNVMLEDGITGADKQETLKAIRAHADVTVARTSNFGIVFVETKLGSDDDKVAESLQKIKGVKHAERMAMHYPARKGRPGLNI